LAEYKILLERSAAWARWFGRRGHAVALAAVVVASLAFRVYVSQRCSLWLDEVWTRHDASVAWPDLLEGASREHPPLMFWFVRGAMALFGTSETALRAPSLLFGCVLLVAVYLLCLELELGATHALLVVASLAVSPFFVRHATEARHYSMFPAFTTLATLFTLRLLRAPGNFGALVGFALSAAASAATHYFGLAYAGALIGTLGVGSFSAWRNGAPRLHLSLRTALVFGALALVLGTVTFRALMLARFYSEHTVGLRGRDLLGSLLHEFSFFDGRPLASRAEPFVAAAGLLFIGLRLRGIARILPFALAFVPCAGALFISSGHSVAPRYLAPSFVFYQLGAAAAVLLLWDLVRGGSARLTTWSALRSVVGAPVLVLPLALRLAQYPAGYGVQGSYYAGLKAYFRGERANHTALVVYPHFPGEFIMGLQYGVDVPMMSLERFRPIEGVDRYVVAEFERPSRARDLQNELNQQLRISPRQWRTLPIVPLAKTEFQPAVHARIVELRP
jgi:hypothetical protein